MMMMMMQKNFDDENNRSLNYTKIDQCQDNNCSDNDDYYRQILHSNEHINYEQDIKLKIILTNRLRLILFIFLILTSQSNAVPIFQSLPISVDSNQSSGLSSIQQSSSSLPIAMVQLTDRSLYPQSLYKVYRRMSNPVQQQKQQQQQQLKNIPSYSNGAVINIYDQTNFINQQQQQQQQSAMIFQNPNEQQLTLQLKRERQRRTMIDRMVSMFDEDGDGQLERDELYSMALRSNMFPKFHHYLKQASS
ncbi:unnamed protein product [Rotaria sordida]|uniref:EF-hand domain-containing protein n=1 Tax=Rotaria sordida TaxID=392033 RepID=A0A813VIK5_9BILA|nr:unnamed protein product [Rotaria sordida]CAF0837181.1 unnamed protein product [Rotaria sordida]CAF3527244.1 unnamed protein product [Rotaria sordida]CAF3570998.1 unnamed protein product [Rotaria sordida]